jgi:hypothetical protein
MYSAASHNNDALIHPKQKPNMLQYAATRPISNKSDIYSLKLSVRFRAQLQNKKNKGNRLNSIASTLNNIRKQNPN